MPCISVRSIVIDAAFIDVLLYLHCQRCDGRLVHRISCEVDLLSA